MTRERRAKGEMQAKKNGFQEEQKDSVFQKCDRRIGQEKGRKSDGKA